MRLNLDLIPWPVNCAVIMGTPLLATIAEYMRLINPLLQAVSFLVAIAWGSVQLYSSWKRRR